MSGKKTDFLHIQGDKDFQHRSDSVFSSLDRLEPQKGEEKEIKRNSRRPHKVPDHVLHPEKWTKYSLEEDGSEKLGRMSANEINKHAALSFLDELKERRKSGDRSQSSKKSADLVKDSDLKHSFSKPKSTDNTDMEKDSKPSNIQTEGVHMMPEYIVGKARVPVKSKKQEPSMPQDDKRKTGVQIEHLLEKEEDEKVDKDIKESRQSPSIEEEESEKGLVRKEQVKFAKRKRKQEKNIRKHVKVSDDEV